MTSWKRRPGAESSCTRRCETGRKCGGFELSGDIRAVCYSSPPGKSPLTYSQNVEGFKNALMLNYKLWPASKHRCIDVKIAARRASSQQSSKLFHLTVIVFTQGSLVHVEDQREVHENQAVQNDSHHLLPGDLHIKRFEKEVLWASNYRTFYFTARLWCV